MYDSRGRMAKGIESLICPKKKKEIKKVDEKKPSFVA